MVFYKYNLTGISQANESGLVTLLQEASRQTNYIPGILLNLGVYIVIFLSLKARGQTSLSSFAACNFYNVIVALLMYILQLVPGWYLVLVIIVLPASMFMLWAGESQ